MSGDLFHISFCEVSGGFERKVHGHFSEVQIFQNVILHPRFELYLALLATPFVLPVMETACETDSLKLPAYKEK